MKIPQHLLLRIPLALALGGLTFSVGLVHLVRLSTSLTGRVISGETPYQAIMALGHQRQFVDRGREAENNPAGRSAPAEATKPVGEHGG